MSTLRRYLPLLVLVLAASLLLAPTPPAQSQTAPSLRLTPDRLTVNVGVTGVVEVQAQGVQDLAAFEVDLTFDPAVVVVEQVERVIGTAAQPTPGRSWASLPMTSGAGYIQLAPGRISFGGYSYGTDNPAGVSGEVTLARLTVGGTWAGQSALSPTRALLVNTAAQAATPTASGGLVIVQGTGHSMFLPYIVASQPPRLP